ncbi:hypothetical protein E5676_scaffold1121G00060 [Cucumis melo var. makuwa]|uniref:Uncharacterized protein n=1 Tax=Cucumis melo var. makuwa TaxID=1194695 RepID=A0A5A7TFR2_CUCMM|nr:hypothetical protein E6C27_scaffold824G00480 [Cucumis melo var. makuwa]TYK14228.1 hypothetical protein E5676_scaffold1121G00060 [Cucumis melo var. makuwa]
MSKMRLSGGWIDKGVELCKICEFLYVDKLLPTKAFYDFDKRGESKKKFYGLKINREKEDDCLVIEEILQPYDKVLSQIINLGKSAVVFSENVNVEDAIYLGKLLGVTISNSLGDCLEMSSQL